MVFNSYIFILLFMPLTVAGYFFFSKLSSRRDGQAELLWLLIMSLWFYAYDVPIFLILFVGDIIINYIIGRRITRLKKKGAAGKRQQKIFVSAGIILNLMPLLYFKYTNFFLDVIWDIYPAEWRLKVALPLGISFFTFMQIAYIVDCYREEKGFDYTFLEYAAYAAFFPKTAMGPIALHSEIIPQFRDKSKRQVNYHNLSQGLYMFALGLAKKVLLADILAKMVNTSYEDMYHLNSMTVIMVMLSYTLQLYFDFSGYCDMAVGVAGMMNIELPYNFNSPYKARSISEFWDRWHMTLTRFFTRYVYIPLGGSRRGKIRTYINTMIVFLLSGLWHGADWGFIIWGLLHGVLMTIEKIGKDLGLRFGKITGIPGKILDGFRWLCTFVLLNITWMFFKAENMFMVKTYFERLFSGGWECQEVMTNVFQDLIEIRILMRLGLGGFIENYADIVIWIVLIILVLAVVFGKNVQEKVKAAKYNWIRSIVTMILIVWCVISLSDVSQFLYFNF